MKLNIYKALFFCAAISLTILVYSSFRDSMGSNKTISLKKDDAFNFVQTEKVEKPMKYILQWTSDQNSPFSDMGKGQSGFKNRNCKHVNCFVTSEKMLLGNYAKFDAIIFSGPEVMPMLFNENSFPEERSARQKYVFASIESPDNYRICSTQFDGYFNWTWTYKLDSEVQWGYIVVRDMHNNIIGPKKEMHWLRLEDMEPVAEELKIKLKNKNKAAAWLVSNCVTKSKREHVFFELRDELLKYNHDIDIFGLCGKSLRCAPEDNTNCAGKMIAENYYFYLSFENAFSEDYVTEKLLHGLNNDAVPIVYGGANYTRFMPDGIYLNAVELGVKELAAKMNELINEPDKYANYFKWRNHYSYHKTTDSVETNEYCRFCELLNDESAVKNITVYNDFQNWWNPPNSSSICKDIYVPPMMPSSMIEGPIVNDHYK